MTQAVVERNLEIFKLYFQRDDKKFREHFRLSIGTFHKLINFLFNNEKKHGWPIEIEIMIFLYWLASGCSYRIVGVSFQMHRSTICRILHKYLKLFSRNLSKFVILPKEDELERIGTGFCKLANNMCFEKAVGALDGCHVKIAKVPECQKSSYFSGHKGFCSSNFQALVDHEGTFINVFIGYPGSVHDTRILRNSPLFYKQLYPPRGYYILGDGGYPLLQKPIGIITPFKGNVVTPFEGRFNTIHSKARTVVERSFGRLKSRWRAIFTKQLECYYLRAPLVIASCICLHNFCVRCDDIIEAENLDPNHDDPNDDPIPQNEQGDVSGLQLRARIAAAASRPVDALPNHLQNDHSYIVIQ